MINYYCLKFVFDFSYILWFKDFDSQINYLLYFERKEDLDYLIGDMIV